MFTYGDRPYSEIEKNSKVIAEVLKGLRLTMPESCPVEVRELAMRCWRSEPSERPSFVEVLETLQKVSQENSGAETSIFHLQESVYLAIPDITALREEYNVMPVW